MQRVLALLALSLTLGCGGDKCANPVIASWKALGGSHESESAVFGPRGDTFEVWIQSCGVEHTVHFTQVPYPPAAGAFPLEWKPDHGLDPNGFAGASYSVSWGDNYFTDASGPDSEGSLVLTGVDTAAKTFAGTFSYRATTDSGTKSVEVTEGKLIRVPYQ